MKVIKRNGDAVPFDKSKIAKALQSANEDLRELDPKQCISKDLISIISTRLYERCRKRIHPTTVEEIQDMVETELMKEGAYELAKVYVKYRYNRAIARDKYQDLMNAIADKVQAKSVQNQNANVDEKSFGGRIGEMSSLVMKQYALDYCMSEMAKNNHLNNEIYIHDLDHYAVGDHNCLTIPFDKLLANGFNTRQTDVRPANSLNTAMQLVAVIFQLQSLQQFGGVSASHIDWTMVPYVRKSFTKHLRDGMRYCENKSDYKIKRFDKWIKYNSEDGTIHLDNEEFKELHPEAWDYAVEMTEKECHQSVEALYHNLNTLQSRSGNQLPFTSINYGTCTLPEGRMVTRELLEVSISGLGRLKRTSVFPCGIFQCMKGVNREPGDPNYDLFKLALRSTAQRLYPNYANIDWSGNAGYDPADPKTYFSTMGCRTANGFDVNGMNQTKDGRGNICPVTIIMPTLAMQAKVEEASDEENINAFLKILDTKIHEARDMLIERFNWICSQSPEAAKFMYENGTMEGYVPEEGIRSALKHGTLAIGQLGLAETLEILVGCNHTSPRGMEVAKRIEQLFKERCAEFKETYRLNFGVYFTPAENLCYTAMARFRAKYGIIPKVSENDYFTNSIHIPVWEEVGVFEKIDLEAELTGYSSAGCITYIELDSGAKNNLEALETIVNYAMDKDIPYFAINVPNDMCSNCGYTDEINEECPVCGESDIRRLRRVTGYLTGDYKTAFNKGKQQEVEMRFRHSQKSELR